MKPIPFDELISRRINKDKLIDLGNGEYKYDGGLFLDGVGLTSLTEIPYNIVEVTGQVWLDRNKLTSLKGCPKIVGSSFLCSHNKLTTLEGCPEEVGNVFWCYDNNVKFTEEYVRSLCNVGGDIEV